MNRRTVGFIVFWLALNLTLAASVRSSQDPASDDLPALLELIRKAGGPAEHPEANALSVLLKDRVEVEENGEFTTLQHALVKILTDKGCREHAAQKIPYHRRYNAVRVLRARVIKKDGRAVDVPPESIKDGTMEETQQMNILDENFRRLSIAFPGVEIGDCLETLVETVSKPMVRDNYNDVTLFQSLDPILDRELTVVAPASRPLRHKVINGRVEYSRSESGGRFVHTWKAAGVPLLVPEPGMGSLLDKAVHVVVSTFKDWASLSRYGHSLNEGKVDSNEGMKAKVLELTADCRTEEEKILAIHRHVSQKIRYMGSSMDVAAFIEPHQATYTFEKQYGVCRDKSILMMAMLKEIGVESYDVMINLARPTDPELPSIFFEHAICGVVLGDGRVVYMDPTLELSAGFGETYVGDRYVLLMDEEGKDLIKLPHVPAERSQARIHSETALLQDGSLSGSVRISGQGFADFALRSIAKQIPAAQFPMIWQQLGTMLAPTIKVSDVKSSDFSDLAAPYEVSFNYKAGDVLVDIGRFMMFKIPLSRFAFDVISVGIFESLTDKAERAFPLFLFSTRGSVQEEVISLPPGFKAVGIPDPLRLTDGPVSLTLETALEDGRVRFRSDFRIEQSSLDAEGYQSLRRVVKALRKFQKSMIIMEKEDKTK
ncbi:MAG: hypothetical protein A2Y86_05955 [Candidatus Aminicenantes bacterium RBG_13_62_12]|nr:MAG: hypothetical protein A2Y86_05955 [Candidatus Aminicenantes bacterium RBG_13_62_12]